MYLKEYGRWPPRWPKWDVWNRLFINQSLLDCSGRQCSFSHIGKQTNLTKAFHKQRLKLLWTDEVWVEQTQHKQKKTRKVDVEDGLEEYEMSFLYYSLDTLWKILNRNYVMVINILFSIQLESHILHLQNWFPKHEFEWKETLTKERTQVNAIKKEKQNKTHPSIFSFDLYMKLFSNNFHANYLLIFLYLLDTKKIKHGIYILCTQYELTWNGAFINSFFHMIIISQASHILQGNSKSTREK